jgi:hypothetical protein
MAEDYKALKPGIEHNGLGYDFVVNHPQDYSAEIQQFD